MNKKLIVTIIFFSFFALVNGQENSWPLTKCMEPALQNNIEIKIRQLEVMRTQKSQNSVLNRMLPVVNLYGDQGYNFGSTIDPSTNGRISSNIQNNNFNLNAKTNLIDFNAFANAKKDKINIELAKAEKEVAANKQESADLIFMGLSDLPGKKRARKTNLNDLVSIYLTLRLFEFLVN